MLYIKMKLARREKKILRQFLMNWREMTIGSILKLLETLQKVVVSRQDKEEIEEYILMVSNRHLTRVQVFGHLYKFMEKPDSRLRGEYNIVRHSRKARRMPTFDENEWLNDYFILTGTCSNFDSSCTV